MIVVLDASAAIEIVFNRSNASLFRGLIELSEKTITTDLYRIEIVNVLWKYYHSKQIDKISAFASLQLAEELIDEFAAISDYNQEALKESLRLDHPAYDFLYLLLARNTNATLLTMDKRLKELAILEGVQTV
jgi:predicted nucleic acid-binding protein